MFKCVTVCVHVYVHLPQSVHPLYYVLGCIDKYRVAPALQGLADWLGVLRQDPSIKHEGVYVLRCGLGGTWWVQSQSLKDALLRVGLLGLDSLGPALGMPPLSSTPEYRYFLSFVPLRSFLIHRAIQAVSASPWHFPTLISRSPSPGLVLFPCWCVHVCMSSPSGLCTPGKQRPGLVPLFMWSLWWGLSVVREKAKNFFLWEPRTGWWAFPPSCGCRWCSEAEGEGESQWGTTGLRGTHWLAQALGRMAAALPSRHREPSSSLGVNRMVRSGFSP